MNIAICDDNLQVIGTFEKIVDDCFLGQHNQYACESFLSGEELLQDISQNTKKYQVYIMDIEMRELSGIETALKIREQDPNCLIIFATSHHELMQEAFDVIPFHFLVKPIDEEKAKRTLLRAFDMLEHAKKIFSFKSGKTTVTLNYEDIVFFESDKRKIYVQTETEKYEYYGTIRDIVDEVSPLMFSQLHHSFVVNMSKVVTMEKDGIRLRSGVHIPVSKTYYQSFNAAYKNYVFARARK